MRVTLRKKQRLVLYYTLSGLEGLNLFPGRYPQVYTHLFTQEHERSMKNAKLCAVRAKARLVVCLDPSLKAGVNDRQTVDYSVALVSKSCHYPAFRLRFVMDATCMDAVAL